MRWGRGLLLSSRRRAGAGTEVATTEGQCRGACACAVRGRVRTLETARGRGAGPRHDVTGPVRGRGPGTLGNGGARGFTAEE